MKQPSFIATLDNCHEEPIHIPGTIQPHGFLVVLDPIELTIRFLSQNVEEYTDFKLDQLLGQSVGVLVGSDVLKQLDQVKGDADFEPINPFVLSLENAKGEAVKMDASLTRNEKYLLLDVEPSSIQDQTAFLSFYHQIRNVVRDLISAEYLQDIFDYAVSETRQLTGFDRVMLYRFDEEYNGEVVAESKVDHLNSFLKQHFPESDIPAQARQLYLRNRVRTIADVNAVASPIVPVASPIDIGTSSLRSVSPIHLQYLRNMGVQASMSISIIVEGKLWGLIACHHYAPHVVPVNVKEAASYLGMIVSYLINTKEQSQQRIRTAELQSLLAKLTGQIANEEDFLDGLRKEASSLMSMMNAQGVVLKVDSKSEVYGSTPSSEWIDQIADWAQKNATLTSDYQTNQLALENEVFKPISKVVSGVYFLSLSQDFDEYIMWLRPEVIETKNWGGKPEKIIEFQDDGSHRLMPRKSFELWQENVQYKSLLWDKVELDIAVNFKGILMNYIVRKSERLKRTNERLEANVKLRTHDLEKEIQDRQQIQNELKIALKDAQQSNAELEQFAYVASHDLQEPLRKIQAFGDRLKELQEGKLDPKSSDYLSRMIGASARMQTLIKDLLSFSRINRSSDPFEQIDANSIIDQVLGDLQVLVQQKEAVIEVEKLGFVYGDKLQIYRIFQNLIQNALKFAKADETPKVIIGKQKDESDGVTFYVKDNGIGFDMAFVDKIFGLFERLHGKSAYEGTGLGLAICRKIVERHQGRIWAESALGEGTTFYVQFPHNPEK